MCNLSEVECFPGIFLPTPYAGWQALRAGLIADTYVQAQVIVQEKKSYGDIIMSDELKVRV